MSDAPMTAQHPELGRAPAQSSRLWARFRLDPAVILGGVIALAAGLRFARLAQPSLWSDEMFVVWLTRFEPHDLLRLVRIVDFHPPLYYLLMKAWVGVAGTGEAALRVPSACFGLLCVPLTYALARRVASDPVSLLSAFLVAVSPFQIMAGQEARMYPLLGALVLAATLALTEAVARGGAVRWLIYAALVTLTAGTDYLGLLVLAAHGVWIACCERRFLGRWLAAAGGAAALYAPWLPSLWDQVIQSHGLDQIVLLHGGPSASGVAVYRLLTDLLGLFAFGGALFGTTGYLSGGSLGPAERLIVLLPFLAVLWWGVTAMASDRRSAALLGLPPAVAIGVTLAASLAKPVFLLRWFSFLMPFYAVFLSRGIVAAGERFREHGDRVSALLAAGLLLYSLPVLDRYYLDPLSRPYQWRAAAARVKTFARPGDFFVYADGPAEQTFTYYFRDAHPSLNLDPVEGGPLGDRRRDPLAAAEVRRLAERFPRVWLVVNGAPNPSVTRRVLPALGVAFRSGGYRDFNGVGVYLFETTAPPPH
ncbi:MAG TPA: glycosyltransferase family 39 protein [bacterium]|nr:glycosyltransferase family 39 protein [bacterium]